MTKPKARYMLELRQEAVRSIEDSQSIAAARTLGMVDQTLLNWRKASASAS